MNPVAFRANSQCKRQLVGAACLPADPKLVAALRPLSALLFRFPSFSSLTHASVYVDVVTIL